MYVYMYTMQEKFLDRQSPMDLAKYIHIWRTMMVHVRRMRYAQFCPLIRIGRGTLNFLHGTPTFPDPFTIQHQLAFIIFNIY